MRFDDSTVAKVKEATGLDVAGLPLRINEDLVRKNDKLKAQGNRQARDGIRPVEDNDFSKLPDIHRNADFTRVGPQRGNGTRTIEFFKRKNGFYYVSDAVRTKAGYLNVSRFVRLPADSPVAKGLLPITPGSGEPNVAAPLASTLTGESDGNLVKAEAAGRTTVVPMLPQRGPQDSTSKTSGGMPAASDPPEGSFRTSLRQVKPFRQDTATPAQPAARSARVVTDMTYSAEPPKPDAPPEEWEAWAKSQLVRIRLNQRKGKPMMQEMKRGPLLSSGSRAITSPKPGTVLGSRLSPEEAEIRLAEQDRLMKLYGWPLKPVPPGVELPEWAKGGGSPPNDPVPHWKPSRGGRVGRVITREREAGATSGGERGARSR